MISTFPTVICSSNLDFLCFAGFYGVALAASAMMATTAMQLQLMLSDQYLIMQVELLK
jgi:K(+)-stimulated pyrophosphate-energized sodium pump